MRNSSHLPKAYQAIQSIRSTLLHFSANRRQLHFKAKHSHRATIKRNSQPSSNVILPRRPMFQERKRPMSTTTPARIKLSQFPARRHRPQPIQPTFQLKKLHNKHTIRTSSIHQHSTRTQDTNNTQGQSTPSNILQRHRQHMPKPQTRHMQSRPYSLRTLRQHTFRRLRQVPPLKFTTNNPHQTTC